MEELWRKGSKDKDCVSTTAYIIRYNDKYIIYVTGFTKTDLNCTFVIRELPI